MSINVHAAVHVTTAHAQQASARDHRVAQPIRYTPPARHEVAPQPVRDHREAQPVRDHREPDRDRDRDDRRVETRVVIDRDDARPIYTYQQERVSLLGATPLASDQLMLNTAGELGGATSLQIESAGSGSTYVSQLVAYDASGCAQVISVNAMLSPQNPMVQVALGNGANIVRIAVDGHSEWGGAIAIQAL